MNRRWIIAIFILLVSSFLIVGQARWSSATDEKFYSNKILRKLDEVVKNQNLMLKELKEIKEKVALR